jgi:TonB-dependent receptor
MPYLVKSRPCSLPHHALAARPASRVTLPAALAFAALLVLPPAALPPVSAQASRAISSDAMQNGSIRGRAVRTDTGAPLAGARISLVGEPGGGVADGAGVFAIEGVRPGTHRLRVEAAGMQPVQVRDVVVRPGIAVSIARVELPPVFDDKATQQLPELQVTAGRIDVTETVIADEVVQMEQFTVSDYDYQIETSLRQAREADTFSNVLTAEKIGTFPDRNLAEALQRVPGLAVQRDGGEGRQIVIRGLNSEYNSTSMDGVQIAANDGSSRQLNLSVLPVETIGAIEVTKVATPDLPGDGMGGSIRIKTRSAFDTKNGKKGKPAATLFAQGRYSDYTKSTRGNKFGGAYGDVFAGGKLGIMLAGSREYRFYTHDQIDTSTNVANTSDTALTYTDGNSDGIYERQAGGGGNGEGGWSWIANPYNAGEKILVLGRNLKYRRHETAQDRTAVSANIEYRPRADAKFNLTAMLATYKTDENRYSFNAPFAGDSNYPVPVPADADADAVYYQSRRAMLEYRNRPTTLEIASVTAAGEWFMGGWKAEARLGYSEGNMKRPDIFEVYFRHAARDQVFAYTFDDFSPAVTLVSGPGLHEYNAETGASTFNEATRARVTDSTSRETNLVGQFDLARSFRLADNLALRVKTGVMARLKAKENAEDVANHHTGAPAGFKYGYFYEPQSRRFPYIDAPRVSARIVDWFWEHYSEFTPARTMTDLYANDWKVDEDVYAAYAMGTLRVGRRLAILGGLRYERTEVDSRGNQITGDIVAPAGRASAYDDFMPGLHLRYEITPKLLARASWSNTLSRPPFAQIAFSRSYNADDDSSQITQGNPALKPLKSNAADLSLEYYFDKHGMVSLAGFYKDISDFTYRTILDAQYDPDTDSIRPVRTYVNGPKALVKGLEFACQQQFRFLPKPFDGLGFTGNVTLLRSHATYPTRPGEKIPLIGQSDTVVNLGLTYEKKRVYLRAAWNYRSPRINEITSLGGNADEDECYAADRQLDLSCTIRVSKNFEVYAEWLNATNESTRYYQRGSHRFVREFFYGPTINLGLRWQL